MFRCRPFPFLLAPLPEQPLTWTIKPFKYNINRHNALRLVIMARGNVPDQIEIGKRSPEGAGTAVVFADNNP